MNINAHKKVGLITGLAMLVGSIVGSGIYFKNNNVFQVTDFSVISTGIAWILACVMSLALAFSFSEIGRIKLDTHETGTTAWIKKLLPSYMTRTLRPFYSLFYFSIYTLILGFLASKFFFDALGVYELVNTATISPAVHMVIGFVVTVLLFIAHYLSRKTMSVIQVVSSVLKLLPLFAMIIAGLILFNTHNLTAEDISASKGTNGKNLFHEKATFNFNDVIISLPMILFAFDAFTSAASIQDKIKNGEKKMPLLITASMLFIVVLYLSLTIIQLLRGTGSVLDTMKDIFPAGAGKPLSFIIMIFVTISVFGTQNGYAYMLRTNFENQLADKDVYIFNKRVKNPKKFAFGSMIAFLTVITLVSFIYGFVNEAINHKKLFSSSDLFLNWLSEVVPVISFFMYGVVVLAYTLKRKNMTHNKINDKLFITVALIGSILSISLMLYEMIYIIPIKPFVDGWTEANTAEFISFFVIIGLSTLYGWINERKYKKELHK